MQASIQPGTRDLPRQAGGVLERLRASRPKIHCITNTVAQAFTANVMLASGAIPSMTTSPEEVGPFAASADALLVNLGTFDAERREALGIVLAERADGRRLSWVLDPVLVDRSAPRAVYARSLVDRRPSVVRLNAAEFRALSGHEPARDALMQYAAAHRTVLALTGTTDIVTDGARSVEIANGHPLMARVTAMGCAESALVAACLAVEGDAFLAALSALLLLNVAGELAGEQARGPGSFAVAILDALDRLDANMIAARARVS
jgi:hydroxyethylthiazole kinase